MTPNNPINESISALVDNESDDLDLKRVLRSAEVEDTTLSTWSRYHMIGSVMRKEQVNLNGMSLVDQISAAVDQEDTTSSFPSSGWGSWRSGLGKVAVAATVALGFVIGFDALENGNSIENAVLANSAESSVQLNDTIPAGFQVPSLSARTVSAGGASSLERDRNPMVYKPSSNSSAVAKAMTPEQSAELQALLGQLMQAHVEQSSEAGAFGVLPMARLSNTIKPPAAASK